MENKNLEILDQLNEEHQATIPAKIIKISYDPELAYGNFILIDPENKEAKPDILGKEIEFIPLKEYGRYTRFNPALNRSDIVSNFFTPFEARKAVDKLSKKLITQLKEEGVGDIRYKLYFFGLFKKGKEYIPAVFVFSGATLQSLIELQNTKLSGVKKWRGYYKFKMKPVKNKNGAVIYFSLDIEPIQLDDEELLQVVKLAPDYIEQIKSYINAMNEFVEDTQMNQQEDKNDTTDIPIDDI